MRLHVSPCTANARGTQLGDNSWAHAPKRQHRPWHIDMRFHIPWCAHCLYHAKVMMSSHPINGIVIAGTARLIMSSPSRTDLGCLTWANQIQVCWLGCHQSKWFGVTSLIEPVLVGQSTRTGSVWSRWLGSIQFYGLALIRFVGRV